MRRVLLLLSVFLFVAAWLAAAAVPFEFWPGTKYDPQVPTYRKVLGYDAGAKISSHAELVKYLEALAAASPRIRVFSYGETWEGRKLIYAAVGSESNLKRLDEIRKGMQALADPRKTPEAAARKLIDSLPAVIWLASGVHGNEISSPEAACVTAYHLVAARGDNVVDGIRDNVVVILAPLQNPDGRDRFVHHFEETAGAEADASPAAAEHAEPWPGGRGNHYLFDMNRDWFALTQPEIRGQVKALEEWYPLVFADLHEMGADSTYYFAPGADPYNPHLTAWQKETLAVFGKNNARWFDRFGFDYFTREVFDAFYPGYGDAWPAYFGSIGMTYEQGTTRGLLIRRSNDTLREYRDAVRQHFTASIATADAAAANRQKLLAGFYEYRKTAIEEGAKEPVQEYILPRAGDTSAVDKLAAVLREQGIELKRATAPFKAAGREFPEGSYVVPMAQPAKRLARVLLDPNVPMDAAFVKEQDRLRQKKLPDEIYDITAWSLPLAYNVEAVASAQPSAGSFEPAQPTFVPPGRMVPAPGAVAYLAPWGTEAAIRLLAAALREDLTVFSSDKAFAQNGRKYPAGTLVFKAHGNPAALADKLERLAKTTGADVFATGTGWVEDGPNFGSRYMVQVKRPAIALAWDRPVSSTSAGQTRFVLERQYGYPVTAVRTSTLATAELDRFHVIILPESRGGYGEVLGAGGVRRLKEWVSGGGTLVALGTAVSFLADPKVGLLAVSQEYASRPADSKAKPDDKPEPKPEAAGGRTPGKLLASEEEYLKAIRAESELPDRVAGVILRARMDPDHWISAGVQPVVNAMVEGRAVYTPIKLDKGVNAALFAGPEELVASGQMWEEVRKQFAYKPFVIVQREGSGQVIGFTADPNFRAFMDGLNVLFMNAVLRGPAHAKSGRGDD